MMANDCNAYIVYIYFIELKNIFSKAGAIISGSVQNVMIGNVVVNAAL
jgi:hypothetical protein